jgi:uncharacterized protein YjbJ (UPF0337 family)
MSIKETVTGRLKQAAGDLTGDEKLRGQGVLEERKAQAKRELREVEQHAERLRDEIARLEYGSRPEETSPRTSSEEPASDEQIGYREAGSQQSVDDAVDTARSQPR